MKTYILYGRFGEDRVGFVREAPNKREAGALSVSISHEYVDLTNGQSEIVPFVLTAIVEVKREDAEKLKGRIDDFIGYSKCCGRTQVRPEGMKTCDKTPIGIIFTALGYHDEDHEWEPFCLDCALSYLNDIS